MTQVLKRSWQPALLVAITIVSRVGLLRVFDVELSNDGFDAVNTLRLLQTQGPASVPRELIDRFILHPLYMLLLYVWRLLVPAGFDFYLAARFLSTLLACVAVVLMFHLVRQAFDDTSAWAAGLLLAFAPSFLWESVTILSSALFLVFYLAVVLALARSRFHLAATLAFLSALVRYEGVVLVALTGLALLLRDRRERRLQPGDWLAFAAACLAVPLVIVGAGWLVTGNALEFVGAQSMASIWLRFLAPGDFINRASFFLLRYDQLFPPAVVWLGVAGAGLALVRHRSRAVALLFALSALYLVFFETLVWFDYTTLEVRFLMYPGLPLLVFAGVALSEGRQALARVTRRRLPAAAVIGSLVACLLVLGWQQGMAGMRFVYNMHASQRQIADELATIVPKGQPTNVMIYAGVSGALDMFARERSLQLAFSYFRYAPDDHPEQYLLDRQVRLIVYPVGNAFATAKYPYLARFEAQTRAGVSFTPVKQLVTSTDNQPYSIWSVAADHE